MKVIFSMITLIILSNLVWSQASKQTYPAPEYTNLPYYFDRGINKLTTLEKTKARMESKTKAMGYGGSSSEYIIEGSQSSVVIHAVDTMEFVMSGNMMMGMMDPSQMISLYQVSESKGDRIAVIQQNKGMFGKSSNDENKISFLVKKSDDKMVLVIPKKLTAGEYAFTSIMNMSGGMNFDAFCFRVEQ